MVFAKLFTSLSAVEYKISDGPLASTCRNANENGRQGQAGKRKAQWEQSDPVPKKQCCQAERPRGNDAAGHLDFTKHWHNSPKTDGKHQSFLHKRKNNSGDGNACQNYHSGNKSNGKRKKQQDNKKFNRQNEQGARGKNNRPHFMTKGGDGRHNNQAFQKRPRLMTQDFKDQNALEVDGQLLCRHFLMGKCIKGDECQLKHVQGYNNLIKLPCKFYIQGFCMKGDGCIYMHDSFPCRFFHRGRRCLQEQNCRFSHDPLNDLTSKLLDEAIQREKDLYEQANAAAQAPGGDPVDTEQSKSLDTNQLPDLFLQPLRPNFYKSSNDVETAEEPPTPQGEDLKPELTLNDVNPQEVDSVEAQSPPAAKPDSPEPVCYSVEAVLGPRLFQPSTCVLPFPGSKEFVPLSSSCTSSHTDPTQAPYSVDAVLNSVKTVEGSTSGHTSASYTQTVSYTPIKSGNEEDARLLKSSTVPCLVKEKDGSQEKCLKSVILSKDLNSQKWTQPSQALRVHKQQCREGGGCSNSAESSTHQVKLDSVSNDVKSSPSFTGEGANVVERGNQSSMSPTGGDSSKFSIPTAVSHSSSKKSTKVAESGTGRNGPLTKRSDLAAECKSTPTRLFHRLFKAPLIVNVLPKEGSTSLSSPENSMLLRSASKSTDGKSERLKMCEQDKAPAARSSISLSTPPNVACVPQSDDNRTSQSQAHTSASNQKAPHSLQAKAKEKSPHPKARRQTSHKSANQPPEQQVQPSSSPSPSEDAQKQLPDVSSHKEAAPAKSVLKTLFSCLSPYQQDRDVNSASYEREDKSKSQVILGRQQESGDEAVQRGRTETAALCKPSSEKVSWREAEMLHRTPGISVETTGLPTLGSAAGPERQVRDSGAHTSPPRGNAAAPGPLLRCIQPAGRRTAERTAADATPFRDLFRTF